MTRIADWSCARVLVVAAVSRGHEDAAFDLGFARLPMLLEVTVADGRRDVAAGSFDFSADPLRIEPGVPARRTLVFPPGMYWRTPDMLSGAPALAATRKGRSDRSAARGGSARTTMVAAASAAPAYGSINAVAGAVLVELRDSDFPTCESVSPIAGCRR